ncbi:MAG: large subunit ribosomal protein [Patescibacteria group bacterium]|nr:large subunit ribosomal protein [Patescibacteria group bacterium]
MKFTIATKENMTQFFSQDGTVFPVTILKAEPMTVVSVKTKDVHGYDAIQVGSGVQKKERVSKALLGHTKGEAFKVIKEFRAEGGDLAPGATIACDIFNAGDMVTISSVSKGKGFQGGMKRWGMSGGWGQHGQKHSAREVGSIGSTGQQRVNKGKRMPGRMGSDRVTRKNVQILDVDATNGIILVKGAVAGKRGTVVELKG